MLDNTQSIICAFGLASAAPRSPYRHLELCGIAYTSGHSPAITEKRGKTMLNVIIFLVGALIMFYMALRSVRARQQLRTKGACVQATVSGTVQSRDGAAYVLEFTTAGGSHRLQYPKPAKGKSFAEGSVVTLYYDPDAPEKMFVEGDKSVLGAELLYAGIGVALLALMVGIMNR
jgi:di/tricarboxylate transporter